MTRVLSIRLTEAEYKILSEAAAEIGANVSTVARLIIQLRGSDPRSLVPDLTDEARDLAVRKQQRKARIRELTKRADRLGLLDLDSGVVALALEAAAIQIKTAGTAES
jgi:hypothetical protein